MKSWINMFVWLMLFLKGGDRGLIIHGSSVWAEHANNYDDCAATSIVLRLIYDLNMYWIYVV